jgi:hypothetical protein
VPTIFLGIWSQLRIPLEINEWLFRVIHRGCSLLTLGDAPKMLRDKSREGSSLETFQEP